MAGGDWDLAQQLIEKGACSLDQVRELLSLQERMRKLGAQPKPFARVLLEKRVATREQLIAAGVPDSELPAEEAAPGRPAPGRGRGLLLGIAGAAGLFLLVLWGRGAFGGGEAPVALAPGAATDADVDALLDRITAQAAASPDASDAAEVMARYEAFLKARAGTRHEIEAHRRLQAYRARVEGLARAELEEIRKKDGELRAAGRYGELAALYRAFPSKYAAVSEAGRAARETAVELERLSAEAWKRDREALEKLLEEGKADEALARAEALAASAPAARAEEAGALRTRAAMEAKEASRKIREELSDVYARKVEGPFREAMARRDAKAAIQAVHGFLSAPWKPVQRRQLPSVYGAALAAAVESGDLARIVALCESGIPEAEDPSTLGPGEVALLDLRNAAHLGTFMRDFQAAYQEATAAGAELDLPTLGKGIFERRGDRTLFVRAGGEILEPETHPLREPDLEALARRKGGADPGWNARAGFFYFYSAPLLPELAFERLARAQAEGGKGIRVYLGSLAQRSQEQFARQLRTKYGAAQDLMKGGQRAQARKVLGELLEHAEHPFVQAMRPDIEKALFEIAEGTEQERRLAVRFKGAIASLPGGRLKATYDFESGEQGDAFESIGQEGSRTFKGRWRIEKGAMESSIEASVMRWKTGLKGDVVVEFDLTPQEEPQNIAVDLYYRRGESAHYAAVFGFDWVGKPEGDLGNTAEERFGMPRTCVIKYPVKVDKSRWSLASGWEGWTSRLVGKGFGDWKAKRGRTDRIRIERRGKGIRMHAGEALIWEGEDDAYSEGDLLFYSDCRCRIDDLAITIPSP